MLTTHLWTRNHQTQCQKVYPLHSFGAELGTSLLLGQPPLLDHQAAGYLQDSLSSMGTTSERLESFTQDFEFDNSTVSTAGETVDLDWGTSEV